MIETHQLKISLFLSKELYNDFKQYRNLYTKLGRISKLSNHDYFTDHRKNTHKA